MSRANGFRFAMLGSGSRGNATLIECGSTRVLLDCGFSMAETGRRLARLGLEPQDLTAILVTHEHSDHVGGVARLATRFGIAVYCSPGTARAAGLEMAEPVNVHETFALGDLAVTPVAVPHDAREPCQYVLSNGAHRLGVLTDTGRSTPHIIESYSGLDALILEANHDRDLLANGPYPAMLKERVGGPLGHLSNDQSAGLLDGLDTARLKHLVAAHLSEKNNTPALAGAAFAGVLGCSLDWIAIAAQDGGLDWRDVR